MRGIYSFEVESSLPNPHIIRNISVHTEPHPQLEHIKVDTLTSNQQLPVPEDVKDYYREMVGGGRQGRQIVPGVFSCGHQGSDMFINMINPHYPSYDRVAGTCQFRMLVENPDVCQVRIDFVDTELLAPTEGDCMDQYLVISGSVWPTGFHRLCGINPDQHFYLHLSKENGFQHIDFTITSVASDIPYKFGLWITQIACNGDSSVMAPAGCTQYHFGSQGSIKSFNFEGVQYLNNQNYKICIRSDLGACYSEFRADPNQFMLEPVAQKSKNNNRGSNSRNKNSHPPSATGDSGCARDYILIPGGSSSVVQDKNTISSDRYCGGSLNPEDGKDVGESVYSRISSNVFWIQLVTGRPDPRQKTKRPHAHGPGVRLRYFQINNCIDGDVFK